MHENFHQLKVHCGLADSKKFFLTILLDMFEDSFHSLAEHRRNIRHNFKGWDVRGLSKPPLKVPS